MNKLVFAASAVMVLGQAAWTPAAVDLVTIPRREATQLTIRS